MEEGHNESAPVQTSRVATTDVPGTQVTAPLRPGLTTIQRSSLPLQRRPVPSAVVSPTQTSSRPRPKRRSLSTGRSMSSFYGETHIPHTSLKRNNLIRGNEDLRTNAPGRTIGHVCVVHRLYTDNSNGLKLVLVKGPGRAVCPEAMGRVSSELEGTVWCRIPRERVLSVARVYFAIHLGRQAEEVPPLFTGFIPFPTEKLLNDLSATVNRPKWWKCWCFRLDQTKPSPPVGATIN